MNNEYLLNTAINLLRREEYLIVLESHNPITFSFKYYSYKFYLIWYSKRGYEDFLYLEYRVYLEPLGCSHSEASEYIKRAKQRDEDIDFKIYKEYISYVIELYIEDPDDFAYPSLRSRLNQIIEVLRYFEVDLNAVMQAQYDEMEEELLNFKSEENDPNWDNNLLKV